MREHRVAPARRRRHDFARKANFLALGVVSHFTATGHGRDLEPPTATKDWQAGLCCLF